ncbi:DNA and RNA helicase [Paenibacillus hexagrammi]|uniref:DNA and RNA helicase n=1 Tax=Paenibacillus hexagrammi TaxID=2908839 RepID=A0ABY3SG39_9BACL|nr:DNA and RNA helicase [Paenibacillus sp. YPD9-1]UJF32214.1 DNA and RNA helicase [Paenibacillus sp. YPD9-1]
MFTDRFPEFRKGRILKAEMLECVRDYPRNLLDIQLQDYSDGIVAGSGIRVGERHIFIGRGMVKHQGRIYVLPEELPLEYRATGVECVIKLRLLSERSDGDFTERLSEVVLDEELSCSPDEMELGRFKLKEGARIRTDYRSFADYATEYNTLCVIHAPYAGIGGPTLNPQMLRTFASELLQSAATDAADLAFGMTCLNQGIAERTIILHYLARKLGAPYKDYTNAVIHRSLCRILESVKAGGTGRMGPRSHGPQRMIVD